MTFYDDLADFYDLIYKDWAQSRERQGVAIDGILRRELGRPPQQIRVLDVACGIGTQAIPLAQRGYSVVARDLSSGAVRRLQREARGLGLEIDAAAADMRTVSSSVEGVADAVVALDNSVPHLTSDAEIVLALKEFRNLLGQGGVVLISVRDYDAVDRSPSSVHPYGERERDGRRYRLAQRWHWTDEAHYKTTFIIEQETADGWTQIVETESTYYAIGLAHLLALMKETGFEAEVVPHHSFYQPVLLGRLP